MGGWDEKDHPRNPDDGKFVDKVGGGGWAGKLADAIGRGRTGGPDEETQRRRNDILDAFNPEATHRREYAKLLKQIGYSDESAQKLIDYHMKYARSGLSVPVNDTALDDMLMAEMSVGDYDTVERLRSGLDANVPDWRFRFGGLSDMFVEFDELNNDAEYD